ncbi:MAG: 3-keto-disaccharide hydrolase [Planctomycetota bacterium]|jgi:hypothetical protein
MNHRQPSQRRGVVPGLVLAAAAVLGPAVAEAAEGADAARRPANNKRAAAKTDKWRRLFDGKTLGKWKVVDKFDYSRHGAVSVKEGRIVLEAGQPGTGVRWTGKFPKIDYEVSLEAMRVDGDDFFCGMTFPVGKESLTLIVGGWGGSVVGLSALEGEPAVENETCRYEDFKANRWYRIRLRVAKSKIEAWIDEKKVVDLVTADREFSIYWEVEPTLPFGIATWRTGGALRDIWVRPIDADAPEKP